MEQTIEHTGQNGRKDRLEANHLEKTYGGRKVVRDVSFHLSCGEIVGLLGPNGAGKTTSFYMVVGLVKAEGGSIVFDSANITKWAMHERARAGIAYLPQESSVFRNMSVEDNILTVLELQNLTSHEMRERLNQLLEEFTITHIATQKAFTLSGGERRRVEIARALAMQPKFLLLDEPFAGIDPIAVADIQKMVASLKKKGIGVLITDHNVRETLRICDRAYLLSEGKIIIEGTPTEIANDPTARQKYLGDEFTL